MLFFVNQRADAKGRMPEWAFTYYMTKGTHFINHAGLDWLSFSQYLMISAIPLYRGCSLVTIKGGHAFEANCQGYQYFL